jgi:serine/threonine-protein kinase
VTRYKIENTPVGQGGFAKVRRGVDEILERKIAVKVLDPVLAAASKEEQERFRREAKILATLSHPNIPAIYDVVFDGTKLEIIFQFIEGDTLRSIIDSDEGVQLSYCRSWFDQLASALEHAHAKGILHRDIKPENIIVSKDRKHCYLVDFGIALSKNDLLRLTPTEDWIGTPGYMSPEQEQGAPLDPSDDLYVLGGCLYEALCGHRIEQGNYQPLATINELLPPALDVLVKKCIASKPTRIKSAAEFRAQLRQALQGHRTFSEILASGQLHELVDAVDQMSASQFMELKAGQRLLILQKCADVVVAEERRFAAARNEFLSVMTCVGVLLEPSEYKKIITPAIRLGFGAVTLEDRGPRGVPMIRDSLMDACHDVAQPNHHAIVDALLAWLSDIALEHQKAGLYHGLRLVIHALMANPECSDGDAPQLAALLERINNLQRSRAAEVEQESPMDDEPALS